MALPWTVFLDANRNGVLDDGEAFTAVKSDTTYAFNNLPAASYTIALQAQPGWQVITPTTTVFSVNLKSGQAKTGENFVVKPA